MIVQLGVIITGIIIFMTLLIFIYYEERFEGTSNELALQTINDIKQSFEETRNHYLNAKRLYVSYQQPLVEIVNTEKAAENTQDLFNKLQQQTTDAVLLREGNMYVKQAVDLSNKAKASFTYINK